MRLISTILLTLLVLASMAIAEPRIPGMTGMGIKLGFGYATIGTSVGEFADVDSYAGGTVGAFVTYGLTPALSLQPELLFVAKGAGGSFFRGRSWRHNYLEIPVLMKYSLSQDRTITPSLFMGPAVAFLLHSEFKSSFIGDNVDTRDAMKGADFSLVFGGALDYRHFSLDIRYDLGLVNVYDPAKWNQLVGAAGPTDMFYMTQNDSIKNRFLSFTLGYRF